jgi:hypothetical protein
MLGKYFVTRTRDNGDKFVTLTDDAPEWLADAVREAHQGDLPDDWIYTECRAACDAIDDGSIASEDDIHAHADSRVEIYTAKLARWYADMCLSSTYSEAECRAEEIGPGDGVNDRLMRIQYCAIEYIAETIFRAFEDNQEEEE